MRSSRRPGSRARRPSSCSRPRDRRFAVRIVLDASVLVSALFGSVSEAAVRRAFREEVWTSGDVEAELGGLGRQLERRFGLDLAARWDAALAALLSHARRAEDPGRLQICRDPTDDAYLSLALAVAADFLVTGDKDLLEIPRERLRAEGLAALAIVTPRQFLDRAGRG